MSPVSGAEPRNARELPTCGGVAWRQDAAGAGSCPRLLKGLANWGLSVLWPGAANVLGID